MIRNEEWIESVKEFLKEIRLDPEIVCGPFERRAFSHFYHQANRSLDSMLKENNHEM